MIDNKHTEQQREDKNIKTTTRNPVGFLVLAGEAFAGHTVVATACRARGVGRVPVLHMEEVASMTAALAPHKQTSHCPMAT